MKISDKWIKTKEDWSPSFHPGKYGNPHNCLALHVSFYKLSDGQYRVCVWGADDYGMDFDHNDKDVVEEIYNKVGDYTTIKDLEEMGFWRA